MTQKNTDSELAGIDPEQLPVASHNLHGWKHFAGMYAAEHVAATEFVIGATFVALGAKTKDILLGLLIGNILAVLSWVFITSPIAVDTRLSLYTYLNRIAGNTMSKLYNWANVLIFTVISAAMITVSSTGIRYVFNIPAQLDWYPSNVWFVVIVIVVGIVAVIVAIFGFNAVSNFSGIAAPWLFVMFLTGAMVLLPILSLDVLGTTLPSGWDELMRIGDQSIWTGMDSEGKEGIGLLEVIGFAWAANSITHFGLIDMVLFRYAKKKSYGVATSTGMLFGHYLAWISAGLMGAGAAIVVGKTIDQLDPGDVAFQALGWSGFIIVIVAGWTTAITNLYRAGMAAQGVFTKVSSKRTTLVVGIFMVVVSCFPFVFKQILPLLTYAGLIVVPVGAIVFAEHQIFPRIGLTRLWSKFQNYKNSVVAIASWALGLAFGFGLNILDIMSFYYLFIPTWLFTIVLYTGLAYLVGASKSYPNGEKEEAAYQERVKKFQRKQGEESTKKEPVATAMTKILDGSAILVLVIIFGLAVNVLFGSDEISAYEVNKQLFFTVAFICTLIYFTLSIISYRQKRT